MIEQALFETVSWLGAAILIAVIMGLSRWVASWWVNVKQNLPDHIADLLEQAAYLGVSIAQQLAESKQIDFGERKDAAIDAAERWLEEIGVEGVDPEVLGDIIESIVYRLKNPEVEVIVLEEEDSDEIFPNG